ncbi:unnamed protein product [Lasius platythorax]|uniref:Uncharacterized protein n=1 Tax=Lasius platythorax TaxID=488582 RepID=A0AAV2P9D6_9HYME
MICDDLCGVERETVSPSHGAATDDTDGYDASYPMWIVREPELNPSGDAELPEKRPFVREANGRVEI